jgi:predicted lipid-binding transport protein (Tim44 family)
MSSFAVQPSRRTGLFGRRLAVLGLVGVLAMGALTPMDAEAKRIGGSRSFGRQSQMAPSQSPSSTGQPQRAQQAQPAQTPPAAAAAAAQPPRNRWMGPLAGLAAGLGIAALLSHFGLGAGLAQMLSNFLLIALVVFAGVALFRFIQRRRRPQLAYPQTGPAPRDGDFSRPSHYATQQPAPAYAPPGATGMGAAASGTNINAPKPGSVPAGFDRDAFTRDAKVSFIRLQAAWDKGDQGDIFEFTTPEMFAEVKMDLEARAGQANRTDVVQLDAELLGVEERGSEQLASVRFHGLIRESEHEAAQPFEEVWNFVKDTRNEQIWRLAGIQQLA